MFTGTEIFGAFDAVGIFDPHIIRLVFRKCKPRVLGVGCSHGLPRLFLAPIFKAVSILSRRRVGSISVRHYADSTFARGDAPLPPAVHGREQQTDVTCRNSRP